VRKIDKVVAFKAQTAFFSNQFACGLEGYTVVYYKVEVVKAFLELQFQIIKPANFVVKEGGFFLERLRAGF